MKFEADKRSGSIASRYPREALGEALGKVFGKASGEVSAAIAYVALLAIVAVAAPGFYSFANMRDLAVGNAPVLIVAVGMTLVILTRQIDISVGSQFAVCSVAAGVIAKMMAAVGMPVVTIFAAVALIGCLFGAINGALVARLKIPSIVATLAVMVATRDGLRWATEGRWVQDLPRGFQWLGLGQSTGQAVIVVPAIALFAAFAWGLKSLAAGRAVYAV